MSIDAGAKLIEHAKQLRYDSIFLIFFRYARLCLLAFTVHYLDIKFKVERGSKRRRAKKETEKKKAESKQAVTCCFSYETFRSLMVSWSKSLLLFVRSLRLL